MPSELPKLIGLDVKIRVAGEAWSAKRCCWHYTGKAKQQKINTG